VRDIKGFTLVELLAVIVLLAIILLIAVPNVLGIIDKSRGDANIRQQGLILGAVRAYAVENPPILPVIGTPEIIRINDLITRGILSPQIKNLSTGENIANDCVIIENLGGGEYDYTYEKNGTEPCTLIP
jgi:prepilin-type N-terminal cleavage/methylation domain-containing protein